MYRKMLVLLDGSKLAEVVFPYAKELAGRLNIDIDLLHVSNPGEEEFIPMHQAYINQAAKAIRKEIKELQKRKNFQPKAEPLQVKGKLVAGYPAEEILRYADENNSDLILIATHGRSGLKRWTMGSVADKVLRASKVPVCLVRAGIPEEVVYDQWPKQTILVPLDGSALAESVLPHVETLAKQRGTELVDVVLLRVCEPPPPPTYYAPELSGVPLNWGEYEQQEIVRSKQVATEYLAGIEKRFKESNISVRSEVLTGKAATVIVDYAKKNPFNLIIMATHGRSGVSRWVYGSVAENILQEVSSPVLLVRQY